MADRYIYRANDAQIWLCTEEGEPVRPVDPVEELNELWATIHHSVNTAILVERTKVQHALMLQNFTKKNVDELRLAPAGPFWLPTHEVHRDDWNRIVRALKAVAEACLLP